jgi:hypothetical protein
MYESERYQRRQRMLRFALNLLIPGGSALYVGAFGKGVTLLVFWSVGAAMIAARPWFLSDPMALVAALQIPIRWRLLRRFRFLRFMWAQP